MCDGTNLTEHIIRTEQYSTLVIMGELSCQASVLCNITTNVNHKSSIKSNFVGRNMPTVLNKSHLHTVSSCDAGTMQKFPGMDLTMFHRRLSGITLFLQILGRACLLQTCSTSSLRRCVGFIWGLHRQLEGNKVAFVLLEHSLNNTVSHGNDTLWAWRDAFSQCWCLGKHWCSSVGIKKNLLLQAPCHVYFSYSRRSLLSIKPQCAKSLTTGSFSLEPTVMTRWNHTFCPLWCFDEH